MNLQNKESNTLDKELKEAVKRFCRTDEAADNLTTFIETLIQREQNKARLEAYKHISLSDVGMKEPLKSWLKGYITEVESLLEKQ